MNKTDQYVYLIVGDGELNEGQCWEAFQYIAHYKLNHCVVIIDDNKTVRWYNKRSNESI